MVKVVVVAGLVGVVRSRSRVGLGRRVSDWHPRYRAARAAKNVHQHKLLFFVAPPKLFVSNYKMYLSQKRCTEAQAVATFNLLWVHFCLLLFCLVSCCSFWRELKKETSPLHLFQDTSHCGQSHGWKRIYFTEVLHISVWKGILEGHQRTDIEKWRAVWVQYCKKFHMWNILNKLAKLRMW